MKLSRFRSNVTFRAAKAIVKLPDDIFLVDNADLRVSELGAARKNKCQFNAICLAEFMSTYRQRGGALYYRSMKDKKDIFSRSFQASVDKVVFEEWNNRFHRSLYEDVGETYLPLKNTTRHYAVRSKTGQVFVYKFTV